MRTLFAVPLLSLILFLVLSPASLVAQSQDDLFQSPSSVNDYQSRSNAGMQPAANRAAENGPISSYSSTTGSFNVKRRAIQGALVLLGLVCCAAILRLYSRGPTKAPPPPIRL